MTCALCKYEFCWACGESASSADRHFGAMRGCGVRMMDDTVKAGRYATNIDGDGEKKSKCDCLTQFFRCQCINRSCCKNFWIAIACIILSPILLVGALPFLFVIMCKDNCRQGTSCFTMGIVYFIVIIIGLILDAIVVPFLIIWALLFFLFKFWLIID